MFHLISVDEKKNEKRTESKMKCHKLEIYGLLGSNKIHFSND